MRYSVEELSPGQYVLMSEDHRLLPVIFARREEAYRIAEMMGAPTSSDETKVASPSLKAL